MYCLVFSQGYRGKILLPLDNSIKLQYNFIIKKMRKEREYTLTFDSLVRESIQVIIEACIFAEGNCELCPNELRDFCSCDKPIDYQTTE